MFYYRYRPGSELSIKELIYDELYFASAAECNDPYEGKVFAKLEKDETSWERLIRSALKSHPVSAYGDLIKRITAYFMSKAPINIDEVMSIPDSEFTRIADNEIEKLVLTSVLECIRNYVAVYIPPEKYFVSFSKSNDNMLMWSHYANNHRGYCLIFRTIDGKIRQHPEWKRTSVSYVTPKSFSPKMSFVIGDSFTFQDIEYVTPPRYINGFMCFPAALNGDAITEEQIKNFRRESENIYFQKHKVWEYEKEVRIVLSSGIPWLAGERLSLTTHQRLFRYDSTQLAGIVLGAKMPESQRHRIREIISEKVNRWHVDSGRERIVSDFVLFTEQLSQTNREVKVEPLEIYNCTGRIDKTDSGFIKRLKEWENGCAIRFSGSSGERIQIK